MYIHTITYICMYIHINNNRFIRVPTVNILSELHIIKFTVISIFDFHIQIHRKLFQ